jgi:hypothetical protein
MNVNSEICDILMVTYNRPAYTRLALQRLLDSCDDRMRVWLWHNGTDQETLAVVGELAEHPAVHRFHHSVENVRLRQPTNWFFAESSGDYLSKVDDDCLVPADWSQKLRAAHAANPDLGLIGCWRFFPEDFVPELANKKIVSLRGGHQLLANCWVEGSGYLMKRQCVQQAGPIRDHESFSHYCIRLARMGWRSGWYFPFLYQEHMDDPRAEHTLLKSDQDLQRFMPLSAESFGAHTLADWRAQLKQSARTLQAAPADPRAYARWRILWRRKVYARIAKGLGLSPLGW